MTEWKHVLRHPDSGIEFVRREEAERKLAELVAAHRAVSSPCKH